MSQSLSAPLPAAPSGADADRPMAGDVESLVQSLRSRWPDRIAAYAFAAAKPPALAPLPADLAPPIARALEARGISALYTHQAAAWDAVAAGHHPLVVTPTASGKSLCYHLPAIQAALTHRDTALYLFPTKALSQDQVADLVSMDGSADLGVRVNTFDGDTPSSARRAVR
ncbi:MAG: DEAD/DEAH box helicase, partial [Pseudomonadota bacterium]